MSTRSSTRFAASMCTALLAVVTASYSADVRAADPPAPTSNSKAQPQSKPAPEKPRVRSRGTLDAKAAAALSASRPSPPTKVAMRTVAPAADDARGSKPKPSGKDARSSKRGKRTAPKDQPKASGDASGSDRKISLDEDFLVEGKLEKPNAFFILRRSQSGYDWARLDAKFLPLVLESVQDPLF
ncbi:MAG: hypothetical protein AAGA54_28770 [Myxococcota bacterium]